MNFPFQRAKPLGWSMFEKLTSAQMNQIDANAAQAADGQIWTDVAAIRNWVKQSGDVLDLKAFQFLPYDGSWWGFHAVGGNLIPCRLAGGSGIWSTKVNPPVGVGLTPNARAAAVNSAGSVMLVSGIAGASTNERFRRYDAATGTWTSPVSSLNSASIVNAMAWAPGPALFLAAHTINGNIETSPDGTAWTSCIVPNANPRACIAVGAGSAGIVVTTTANVSTCIHSTDGVTWVARTLPSAQVWNNVVWVPLLGLFVAFNNTMTERATSPDGITWTAAAIALPASLASVAAIDEQVQNVAAYGRTIALPVASAGLPSEIFLLYSQDAGATWSYAFSAGVLGASIGGFASNGRQALFDLNGVGTFMSVATGA